MQTGHEPDDQTVEQFVQQHPGGAIEEDIAEVFGCTRQRVHTIIANALCKLRRRLQGHSLTDFITERPAGSPAARMADLGQPR